MTNSYNCAYRKFIKMFRAQKYLCCPLMLGQHITSYGVFIEGTSNHIPWFQPFQPYCYFLLTCLLLAYYFLFMELNLVIRSIKYSCKTENKADHHFITHFFIWMLLYVMFFISFFLLLYYTKANVYIN